MFLINGRLVHVTHKRKHRWELSLILKQSFMMGMLSCNKLGCLINGDKNETRTWRNMDKIRGCHSGVAEVSRLLGCYDVSMITTVTDVSKNRAALLFYVKQFTLVVPSLTLKETAFCYHSVFRNFSLFSEQTSVAFLHSGDLLEFVIQHIYAMFSRM
jgi:hypothetical protein